MADLELTHSPRKRAMHLYKGNDAPARAKTYSPNNHGPKLRIVAVVIIREPKLPAGPPPRLRKFLWALNGPQ
jgi:hypothetical protein